jgi:hypothetical protein
MSKQGLGSRLTSGGESMSTGGAKKGGAKKSAKKSGAKYAKTAGPKRPREPKGRGPVRPSKKSGGK